MPIGKYLERRDIQLFIIAGFFITLLLMHRYGAFIAYGVPAITFHTVTQTKPISKSVNILSSYGDWVSYEYYGEAEAKWQSLVGYRYVKVTLNAELKIKVEATDLMLSGYLTEIKPPPFLINETQTEILYQNMTVQAYAYGFKITTAWSGSAQVTVPKDEESGLIPWTVPSKEEMVKTCVRDKLLPDFNTQYLTAAKLLLSIDAPTLGRDKSYELRPDYIGIAGMWLADYQKVGYTGGTAAEMLPASKGTAVKLYRDSDLTVPCWAPDYTTALGTPKLTPDVVYWLDHFAPYSAWWSISIVNIGSQLVYDDSKAHPNYISWAWEKYPVDQDNDGETDVPAVAQWFRCDLLFRTTKGWTVPKIPEYELPPEEKEKMHIIVTVEPEHQGEPLNLPPVTYFPYTEILYLLLTVFGGMIAVIIVYYVAKGRLGVKRT